MNENDQELLYFIDNEGGAYGGAAYGIRAEEFENKELRQAWANFLALHEKADGARAKFDHITEKLGFDY